VTFALQVSFAETSLCDGSFAVAVTVFFYPPSSGRPSSVAMRHQYSVVGVVEVE
jgi:hypothetical protein